MPPCVFLYIVDVPRPLNISGYSYILLIYLLHILEHSCKSLNTLVYPWTLLYILEHSCIFLNTLVYLCILLFLRSRVTEGTGRGGGENGVHGKTGHPPRPATRCDGSLLSLTWASEVGGGAYWCIPLPPAVRQGKLLDNPVVSLKNSQIEDVLKWRGIFEPWWSLEVKLRAYTVWAVHGLVSCRPHPRGEGLVTFNRFLRLH